MKVPNVSRTDECEFVYRRRELISTVMPQTAEPTDTGMAIGPEVAESLDYRCLSRSSCGHPKAYEPVVQLLRTLDDEGEPL
jgi:hypothetical protein